MKSSPVPPGPSFQAVKKRHLIEMKVLTNEMVGLSVFAKHFIYIHIYIYNYVDPNCSLHLINVKKGYCYHETLY